MSSIAFLLPSMAHGGAQKVFLEISSYLTEQRINVVLISLDREGELLDRIPPDLKVVYLDDGLKTSGVKKRIIQWFRLRSYIADNKIGNLFSTVTGMNIFTLSCFLFSKNIKITIREATPIENTSSLFIKLFIWLLYKRSNRVICTSNYIKKQLNSFAGIHNSKIDVLPNPIDIDRIKKFSKLSLDLEHTFPSARFTIVAVGRLIRAKGFDTLIDALLIARKAEDIKLIIVGEGPERLNLENQIKRSLLENDVLLAGYQANPYPYILNSDLFVLPSRWEGYVNVVIEAMALEVDVVVTDCNSAPGTLLKEKLNYPLVPTESPADLAHAILENLLSPRDTTAFATLLKKNKLANAIDLYFDDGDLL